MTTKQKKINELVEDILSTLSELSDMQKQEVIILVKRKLQTETSSYIKAKQSAEKQSGV